MRTFSENTMAADGAQEKEEPLWLGLDLSTQSLTAAVLRGDGVGGNFNQPVVLESINYEVRLGCKLVCRSIFSAPIVLSHASRHVLGYGVPLWNRYTEEGCIGRIFSVIRPPQTGRLCKVEFSS